MIKYITLDDYFRKMKSLNIRFEAEKIDEALSFFDNAPTKSDLIRAAVSIGMKHLIAYRIGMTTNEFVGFLYAEQDFDEMLTNMRQIENGTFDHEL